MSSEAAKGVNATARAARAGGTCLFEFGLSLVETRDLDPVYVLLWETGLDRPLLWRWLLAYWCFYHVGTACWAAEAGGERAFWRRMARAAGSRAYPRSAERRHFRGAQAERSVAFLAGRGVTALAGPLERAGAGGPADAEEIVGLVRGWLGFGPWIAFKAADMLERLAVVLVRFDGGSSLLFDSPRAGASLAWSRYRGGPEPKDVVPWALAEVVTRCRRPGRPPPAAPPRYERPLGVQEAETVLCKWKSHCGGRYHVGEDVAACRRGLLRFARESKLAQRLLRAGKGGGLW